MTTQDADKPTSSRVNIIEAVQKPINFFALVVLVVEGIFGIMANISEGNDRTILIIGMLALIFSLVGIVTGMAILKPHVLRGEEDEKENEEPREKIKELDSSIASSKVESIRKPKFLLASDNYEQSKTFLNEDEKIINKWFSKKQIDVHNGITCEQLSGLLTGNQYDIIHLTIRADESNGYLYFPEGENLSPEGFRELLKLCSAKLVVLAICHSAKVSSAVGEVTNMVAAFGQMDNKQLIKWENTFYQLLSSGHPLSKAYNTAKVINPIMLSMNLYSDFSVISD